MRLLILMSRAGILGMTLIFAAALSAQTPQPTQPLLTDTEQHPSAMTPTERIDSSYSKQPLWAQRLAAEQRMRREMIRLQGYEPMRPDASSMPLWNRAPYGRPAYYIYPMIVPVYGY